MQMLLDAIGGVVRLTDAAFSILTPRKVGTLREQVARTIIIIRVSGRSPSSATISRQSFVEHLAVSRFGSCPNNDIAV